MKPPVTFTLYIKSNEETPFPKVEKILANNLELPVREVNMEFAPNSPGLLTLTIFMNHVVIKTIPTQEE